MMEVNFKSPCLDKPEADAEVDEDMRFQKSFQVHVFLYLSVDMHKYCVVCILSFVLVFYICQ